MHIDPKNDFAFHWVFGRVENKDILLSFLNAVFKLPPSEKLTDIILIDTNLTKEVLQEKASRLDVRAETKTGEQINIEIQLINEHNTEKRTLFYWSRMYTSQLKAGQNYSKLKKTVTINILNFNYIATSKYHNIFQLLERDSRVLLTDVLEIHFLELPKLKQKEVTLETPLVNWLLFFKAFRDQKLREVLAVNEPAIGKAMRALDLIEQDEQARRIYELREKARYDYTSAMDARLEQGKAEGKLEGKTEGKMERTIEIARNMLLLKMNIDVIQKTTGLSSEEISKLVH